MRPDSSSKTAILCTCPMCQLEFLAYPSRVIPGVKLFCSRECSAAFGTIRAKQQDRVKARLVRLMTVDSATGCWLYLGHKSPRGYGTFKYRRTDGLWGSCAHRASYEVYVGEIPASLELDHLCRNPACINPAHLEPVLHQVNVLRGEGPSAVAARVRACPKGHEYDEANTYVDKLGKRHCRACHRARRAVWRQRRLTGEHLGLDRVGLVVEVQKGSRG